MDVAGKNLYELQRQVQLASSRDEFASAEAVVGDIRSAESIDQVHAMLKV